VSAEAALCVFGHAYFDSGIVSGLRQKSLSRQGLREAGGAGHESAYCADSPHTSSCWMNRFPRVANLSGQTLHDAKGQYTEPRANRADQKEGPEQETPLLRA